jgi:hypothetical protein
MSTPALQPRHFTLQLIECQLHYQAIKSPEPIKSAAAAGHAASTTSSFIFSSTIFSRRRFMRFLAHAATSDKHSTRLHVDGSIHHHFIMCLRTFFGRLGPFAWLQIIIIANFIRHHARERPGVLAIGETKNELLLSGPTST